MTYKSNLFDGVSQGVVVTHIKGALADLQSKKPDAPVMRTVEGNAFSLIPAGKVKPGRHDEIRGTKFLNGDKTI